MAPLLRDPRLRDYAVVAIQEPWVNTHGDAPLTHFPREAADHFHIVWPAAEQGAPRVCTYIQKALRWQVTFISTHVISTAVQPAPGRPWIMVHNVYNPPQTSANEGVADLLQALEAADRQQRASGEPAEHVVVGDFNIHDSLWAGEARWLPQAQHNGARAEALKQIIEQRPLEMITPAGLITRPTPISARDETSDNAGPGTLSAEERVAGTTIDLTLVSWGLTDHVTHVREANLDGDSDHLPIETELDATFEPEPPKRRRNWAAMDSQKLATALTARLPPSLPAEATQGDVDQFVGELVGAITAAIDATVPWLRPSLYSRTGFTPECRSLLRDKKRIRRLISRYRSEHHCEAPLPLQARLARATRACKRAVQRCRRNTFRQQITDIADMDDVWRAVRWTKNRGPYQAYTPPLWDPRTGSVAYGAKEKADLLARQFFPPPPQANLDDLRRYDYPEPVRVPEFRDHEVLSALRSVKADKAPGPDGITNRVLQAVSHVLVPYLTGLYNQCVRLSYCPEHFRDAATIALRKPGKPDYSVPKAYRPIALLNTLSKLLEALIASRLSYLAEAHGLLPDNHFGGRKGQGTENALHAALEAIHSGWKNGKVVSALLLDISGAFDNVSHDRLLHNLRARRIPQAYVTWLGSFLRGRTTSLVLPEYTMPTRRVETGIPQGSPLSPILYIFYNAGLMGRGAPEWGTDNIGYIDDTTMLATGDSEQANCLRLREHYRRGCLRWAATHASRFEPSKFQLIHFHPQGRRAQGLSARGQGASTEQGEPLDLGDGQVIQPSTTARLLGVILDQHLTFEAHLKHVDSAATRRLQAISALGGSKWGLRLQELRHVYTACITPIMLYAASVWYAPPVRGRKRLHSQQTKVLNRIQRRAGKLIAGAFRTVSGAAFNAELHLTPMPLLLRQRRIQTLIRIATTPAYRMHILDRRRRHHRNPLLHSPLEAAEEEVELATGIDPRELETRLPWAVPPWWEPPEVVIEATKERSIIHHDIHCIAYPEAIRIYTDGSGIWGRVGTAAVCLDPLSADNVTLGLTPNTRCRLRRLRGWCWPCGSSNEI
jgi:exonuclease III